MDSSTNPISRGDKKNDALLGKDVTVIHSQHWASQSVSVTITTYLNQVIYKERGLFSSWISVGECRSVAGASFLVSGEDQNGAEDITWQDRAQVSLPLLIQLLSHHGHHSP